MRKRKKWLLLGIALFLLILFGLSQFYAYIMKDQWNERSAAKEVAKTRAGLTEVSKAQKSVWDENSVYWVLTGKNEAGTDLMVWVRFTVDGKPAGGDNGVYAEELAKGTSEKQIRSIIASQLPGIDIKRLLPGVYNGEYAWQLFYKQEGRYYYKFFRFADGTAIGDGYTLPSK
ncbi:cell wall elongation regulator TseB-like domain-containing protein [Paenibacillus sp. FSL M7-1046]|uniref:cell wall elongation regulator TseB-like domain-containing protein n=1 Tax=Paenibacillus sp. FSL M7-1046 TaxID=2975315 RepID=UPI0030FCF5F3